MRAMLMLDDYIFSVYRNTDYERLVRTTRSGISNLDRAGQAPVGQKTTDPLDTIQITGQTLGVGAKYSLEALRAKVKADRPCLMVSGNGVVLGMWTLKSLTETQEKLIDTGDALKTGFSLALEEVA